MPPPPPTPKSQLKRTAPESRELDPSAKRQKIQQSVIAKSSRLEQRKKGEEKRKRKAEKDEELRIARIKKVEERIETHWSEVMLIQSALSRSAFIPFTPDESEACQTQAWIDTCRVTIKEMIDSGRYTFDECDFIRKRVNERTPQFNTAASAKFNRIMKELTSRSEEEMDVRRANHPDACEIENFISNDLLEMWSVCKDKFIKAYYFWKVVPLQDECSKLDALNNFLCLYNEELRRKIFTQAELAEPKPKIVKLPGKKQFPLPLLPRSNVPNRKMIDDEVDEALLMESSHRANKNNVKTMEVKVLSAYYNMDEEEKPAEDL